MARVALIAGQAQSLVNFRGPLIDALLTQGHDVHAFGPTADADTLAWLGARGVTYRAIPLARTGLSPIGDAATLRALFTGFRDIRPDVVIAYTIKPVIYGMIAARLAGVPRRYAMITGLGYAFTDGVKSLKRRVARMAAMTLYRLALAQAHKVLFQNNDDLGEFHQLRLLSADTATGLVNGSGVDLARFTPQPLPDVPVFLMIGRLLADKGVVEYIQAARALRAARPDAHCVLLGARDGNPAAMPAGLLERAVADSVIDWRGEMQDVRPAIAESSVFVLPSYREGTPRSVLEAMAMGRPVITTDAPGCRETVSDGVNGILVPVRDTAALVRAMVRLSDSADLRARMGQAGLACARARYDAGVVARSVLEHFDLQVEIEAERPARAILGAVSA